MFCSACGTANEDEATSCRFCGEALIQKRAENLPKTTSRKWASKRLLWFSLPVAAMLVLGGIAVYYYRANREFEIIGELLYRNEKGVHAIAGATVDVLHEKSASISRVANSSGANIRYPQLLDRELSLKLNYPGFYDASKDTRFAKLQLAPLSKMDWTWWEIERLQSCYWGPQLFAEALNSPVSVATTSTDTSGHFWLKLKPGTYIITAESEVPSFWRDREGPVHSADTSQPVAGRAFWSVPITVTGNMRVVTADADCSPD